MASDDKDNGKSAYRKWFDDPYMFNIPDATYDDLPELIGSLKRAAIDAYVRDKLAPPQAEGQRHESHAQTQTVKAAEKRQRQRQTLDRRNVTTATSLQNLNQFEKKSKRFSNPG